VFAVMTLSSLGELISSGGSRDHLPPDATQAISDDVAVVSHEGNLYFGHRDDEPTPPLIYVDLSAWWTFVEHADDPNIVHIEIMARFFERIDRASRSFRQEDVVIPRHWNRFNYRNLVAFFAIPRAFNWESYRWIAERLPDGGACFWRLTGSDDELRLENLTPIDRY
jgi:hypothetical protein